MRMVTRGLCRYEIAVFWNAGRPKIPLRRSQSREDRNEGWPRASAPTAWQRRKEPPDSGLIPNASQSAGLTSEVTEWDRLSHFPLGCDKAVYSSSRWRSHRWNRGTRIL